MTKRCDTLLSEALPRPLKNHNVTINGRRTTMRLEPSIWDALHEISRREGMPVNDLCARVKRQLDAAEEKRHKLGWSSRMPLAESRAVTFASAMRVFIVSYFRQLAEPSSEFMSEDAPFATRPAEAD